MEILIDCININMINSYQQVTQSCLLKFPKFDMKVNLLVKDTRILINTYAASYLDVNDVALLVDAHVCGQGNWACEVNADN